MDFQQYALTDAQGRFRFVGAPAGTFEIVVHAPGEARRRWPIELTTGQRLEQLRL